MVINIDYNCLMQFPIFILTILFFALIKILVPLKTLENGLNFFFKYLKGEEKNINKLNINTNGEF